MSGRKANDERNAVRTVRDVVFHVAHGVPLRLDLHLPSQEPALAGILYFHGGSWRRGDRSDHEATRAIELAARGFAVAAVEYRLTSTAPFPAQLEDAQAAVEWMQSQGSTYGLRSPSVGAWGASAGGNLAALLALGTVQEPPLVSAAVSWFAPLDLSTMIAKGPLEQELFPNSAVDALFGHPLDRSLEICRQAEPLSMVKPSSAPMLLMTGDRDRVIDPAASRRMHDALVHHGVASALHVIGGAGHEDPAFNDPLVLDLVAAFFKSHLTPQRHTKPIDWRTRARADAD